MSGNNGFPTNSKNLKAEDIYNCDEGGLYYRVLPDNLLSFKTVLTMNNITVLLAYNMTRIDKNLLLIQKPKLF